jgi:uncharacterized Zn-binding protein involved in type VI secretion
MGQPVARQGDPVTAVDFHLVQQPGPQPPALLPHPFSGVLDGRLSGNVQVMGRPAAALGSTAANQPPHVPMGGTFLRPPANVATIRAGSASVRVNGRPLARNGDLVSTCNDPADVPGATLVSLGTVVAG